MDEIQNNNRWHDLDPDITEILDLISEMSREKKEEMGRSILEIVKILRNADSEILPVSLGKKKVLGLYKAYQKRRWYDKNPILMNAVNSLMTLPEEERAIITQGILITLSSEEE